MIIYFLLALVVLTAGIIRARKNYNDIKKFSLSMTATIALATIILSVPYYWNKFNDLVLTLLSAIRYGPSVISMKVESDVVSSLNMTEPLASMYKYLLYTLYIIGPMAASVYLISYSRLINEWLATLRFKNIHVFSVLDEKTLSIGESIYKDDKKQLLVYCNGDKTKDESLNTKARSIRAMILKKKETDIHLRRNRHYEFYEISESNEKCLSDTVKLCDDLLKEKNFVQSNVIVRIFIGRESIEYIRRLDRAYGKKIYLRYIDEDSASAIELLRKLKPHLVNRKHNEILFLKAGKTAQVLISHMLYLLNEPDSTTTMHIVDSEVIKIIRQMKMHNPEILNLSEEKYLTLKNAGGNYDLRFHEADSTNSTLFEVLTKIKEPDIICICGEKDEDNFELMQRLKRFYASRNDDLAYPLMAVQIKDPEMNKILDESDALFFGNISTRYNYSSIVHPELERAARRVHMSYLIADNKDIFERSEEEQEKILQDTGYYDYVNTESSMAEALTLEYRYDYILGQKKDEEMDDREYVRAWLNNKDNIKIIGDAEHNRWNAYQRLQGWRKPNLKQEEKIAEKYSGNKIKDNDLMLHPALVSIADLPKAEETADRLLKKYNEKADTTKYVRLDQDIYAHIIEILEK